MSAPEYAVVINQGADFSMVLILRNGEGEPVDLSGATVQAELRAGWDKPKLGEFSVAILDASGGRLRLTLSGAASAEMSPGSGFYDVLLIDAESQRQRILEGTFRIRPAITQHV